jgi:hypothetical protein
MPSAPHNRFSPLEFVGRDENALPAQQFQRRFQAFCGDSMFNIAEQAARFPHHPVQGMRRAVENHPPQQIEKPLFTPSELFENRRLGIRRDRMTPCRDQTPGKLGIVQRLTEQARICLYLIHNVSRIRCRNHDFKQTLCQMSSQNISCDGNRAVQSRQ